MKVRDWREPVVLGEFDPVPGPESYEDLARMRVEALEARERLEEAKRLREASVDSLKCVCWCLLGCLVGAAILFLVVLGLKS